MCGTEEVGIEDEEVMDTKDEIPEAIIFPLIKTEEVIDTKDEIPEGISFRPMETEQENGNYKFPVKSYQHCTSYTVFWSIGVILWKVSHRPKANEPRQTNDRKTSHSYLSIKLICEVCKESHSTSQYFTA